jgi:Tat protein secretion system quality control protein TatD with DNase activity
VDPKRGLNIKENRAPVSVLSHHKQDNVRTTLNVVHSRNHCYNGNATVRSIFIAVGVYVAVNNIKLFTVAMELQEWVFLYC